MRIPLFLTIPVILATVVFIWWVNTRKMDFLSPPSESQLDQIRSEALASLTVSSIENDAISVKVPLPYRDPTMVEPSELEPVDLGDIKSPPVLDEYSDRAPEGASKLIALGEALAQEGAFQRALLAYERVLDLSQSDPMEIQNAIEEIRVLRPTLPRWNTDDEASMPVVVHIGTGEKFADILPEILDQITTDLDRASSGLIDFSFELHIGRAILATDSPTPLAIWITGSGVKAPSTDVLSFTTTDPTTLDVDLLKIIFNLIRSHLSKSASYNPAPEAMEDPRSALNSNITRLLWKEFGTLLNPAVDG